MAEHDSADPRLYRYKPLKRTSSIRMLKLRPAHNERDEIHCDLDEVNFVDPLPQQDPECKDYEALSWCWGRQMACKTIQLSEGNEEFPFKVTRNLESALRGLRRTDKNRFLWVDAICINQQDIGERNQQVPRMDVIYGYARSVCIWLGDGDDETQRAIRFIKSQVLSLWEFDKLCESLDNATEWASFMNLLKKPWFSRRWVVQEVALSKEGTIHCGREEISWQDFADAVSLFVEVESATHRLSDVMKMDKKYGHIPDFFGNVPSLGAALLVDATSNLFRSSETGGKESLSSLEYLVSRLSVFEATRPHDTIYALLAIAKDTSPEHKVEQMTAQEQTARKWGQGRLSREGYHVDYNLPAEAVYQEFMSFAIRKSKNNNPLDIMCRPWAPPIKKERRHVGMMREIREATSDDADEECELPSWIPKLEGAAFAMGEHPTAGYRMYRKNADPLVGMPALGQQNYSAAGTRSSEPPHFKRREKHWSMTVEGFILDKVDTVKEVSREAFIPRDWTDTVNWKNYGEDPPPKFWRTLVGDRGLNGRNPPVFYPRACRESIAKLRKAGLTTQGLINEGRCTIVAEFLRRVQAVIWNRCLMLTDEKCLGLVPENVKPGFHICILYGCSVPVVLEKKILSEEEIKEEEQEEMSIHGPKLVQRLRERRKSKADMEQKAKEDKERKQKEEQMRAEEEEHKFREEERRIKEEKDEMARKTRRLTYIGLASLLLAIFLGLVHFWNTYVWAPLLITCLFLFRFPAVAYQDRVRGAKEYSAVWNPPRMITYSFKVAIGLPIMVRIITSQEDLRCAIRELQETPVLHSIVLPTIFMLIGIFCSSISTRVLLGSTHSAFALPKSPPDHLPDGSLDPKRTDDPAEKEGPKVSGKALSGTVRSDDLQTEAKGPEVEQKPGNENARADGQQNKTKVPGIQQKPENEATRGIYWRFVGECYVHGMMNGEAIELQNREGIKAQKFELR